MAIDGSRQMTGSASAQGVPTAAVKVVGGSGGGGTKKMTGSAPAQGVPTAAVKVVGGSGGGGTKKIGLGAVLAFLFLIFLGFSKFSQLPQIYKRPLALQRRIVF